MKKFPCTKCGCCCKRIKEITEMMDNFNPEDDFYFPYKVDDNGRCEKLTKDNKCSVYDHRPILCDIEKASKLVPIPVDEFYMTNISACNSMMDEDDIPKEFRINLNHK